jgi:hypothetical protein
MVSSRNGKSLENIVGGESASGFSAVDGNLPIRVEGISDHDKTGFGRLNLEKNLTRGVLEDLKMGGGFPVFDPLSRTFAIFQNGQIAGIETFLGGQSQGFSGSSHKLDSFGEINPWDKFMALVDGQALGRDPTLQRGVLDRRSGWENNV